MTETTELALENLLLPEHSALRDIFGDVLTKRSTQRGSDCFIFRLLAHNHVHELGELNRDCSVYIRELGLEEAKRKCRRELKGMERRPMREFNARCGDFLAEMAAIRVLSNDGFYQFRSIAESQPETNDYRAYWRQVPAYVEVKNLHANETILDVFKREIGRAHQRQPSAYAFDLRIDYAFDYPPTGEQERIIRDFIPRIGGRKPPFRETLNLVNGLATIDVTVGAGTTFLCRGVGGDWPEAVNHEWVLRKVREKAEQGREQIPIGDHMKVFVINVDSTNAVLPFDFVGNAEQEIREVFGNNVRPYVLHFRHSVKLINS